HLTGLPNRASMQARIDAALERATREGSSVALLFCDLDGIKLVNDTLGHALGDEVLGDVAGRLSALTGPGVCVGRHGGDEFLVLLEDLPHDRDAALAIARGYGDRVAAAFAAPFAAGSATFELTTSAGIAVFPWHADGALALLERADSAMYEAKRAGRAQTVVFERARERPFSELEATLRVRHALAVGELELHYQPVIEIAAGGGLGGLEALIRWRDPDRGLVMPGQFLPLIEHSPLLEELGEWVFTEVCRQLADWRTRGFTPRVSFNIPARQLRRPGFGEFVLRVAAETGTDLTRIAAEITESANVDLDPVLPVLDQLCDAGLVLSLDDFGKGYSSFARLRDMPFSLLKTDLSFMRGVPADTTAVDVLEAMVRLGTTLGLVTIVEGVETEAQLDALLAIGVRVAQGFLFGRAAPAAEIEARYAGAATQPRTG
ncbi:MAG: hypothetical protein QOI80_1982, partial [Solirubrobacteraceae bacterium]|nr:hypothetical protein [Solirubrobacteraceae bacterium]